MSFWDIFKAKRIVFNPKDYADSSTISDDEKQYYHHPDEYYTLIVHEGTPFQKKVITFEERKKISYPSKNGLYVAEILLLEYCSKGKYPKPNNGYPAFWWFEYGIRDIGKVLKSLEMRNFINMNPENGKYRLTEIGKQELNDNEYVPFMHKRKDKTTEDTRYGITFNVWEVNRRLKTKLDWKKIVSDIENQKIQYSSNKKSEREQTLKELEKWNPKLATKLRVSDKKFAEEDQKLAEIIAAENEYKESKNIEKYILFWEEIWNNGGLDFLGAHWTFRLPDLYIKQKRYDDALKILDRIKNTNFADKKILYIEKIDKRISQQNKNN